MTPTRYTSSTYGDNESLGDDDLQHLNNKGNVSQFQQIRKSSSTYFDNINPYGKDYKSDGVRLDQQRWKSLSKDAVYYYGIDLLFGKVVCMIFKNPETLKFGSLIISRHGSSKFESMSLKPNSKYYPAVKNLPKEMQHDNIRKILAISILKLYATLDDATHDYLLKTSRLTPDFDYDETIAGEVASRMKIINNQTPEEIGELLLSMGYTEPLKTINSSVVDVVYHNKLNGEESERLIDENNELAFLLGDQLEHLFDPLTEYSPEPTEKVYRAPSTPSSTQDTADDVLVKNVCLELVKVQTNFTVSLVTFLQKFIVPLRVRVMEGKVKNFTTAKLNIIFPPTIDEITRINCIFLDVLNLAAPYGSFEIMKACGTTIPYFYKAYMRHEAATKNLHSLLDGFFKECKENNIQIFETEIVYDKSSIESIVNSSPNLTKIQLIINRLMETKKWETERIPDVTKYFNSCLDTISSFGTDKLKPYNHRIFTPTGKLLTEFASGWPSELQFGWLTRRLVAVCDVRNVAPRSIKDMYVLIVFSDHILLLEIDDDSYYADQYSDTEDGIYRPSVADCLMHSLVNEVPISKIPTMKVAAWSSVNDTIASHHGFGSKSFLDLLFLGNEFGERSSYVFEVFQANIDYVIDVFNKAKILNKAQPFHLFKSSIDSFYSYYTAHEQESYELEEVKSPIVIYLNSEVSQELLEEKQLFGAISLSFSDSGVEVHGITQGHTDINVVQTREYLHLFLADVIRQMVSEYITLDNKLLMPFFIKGNDVLVSEALFSLSLTPKQKQKQQRLIHKRVAQHRKEFEEMERLEKVQVVKSHSRANSLDALTTKRQPSTRIRRDKKDNKTKSLNSNKAQTNGQSFFARLFQKKAKQPKKQKSQDTVETKPKNESVSKKRLSQLFLSGEMPIVVPSPLKTRQPPSPVSFANQRVDSASNFSEAGISTKSAGGANNITATSSSIIVNSHFAFPAMENEAANNADNKDQRSELTLENKSTILPENSSSTLGDLLKVDIPDSTFTRSLSGLEDYNQPPVQMKRLEDEKPSTSSNTFKKPRTPPTSQLFSALGNLMNGKQNKTLETTAETSSDIFNSRPANGPSTVPVPQNFRSKIDGGNKPKSETNYFNNFREAAIQQENQQSQSQKVVQQSTWNQMQAPAISSGRGYPPIQKSVISPRKLDTSKEETNKGMWLVNDTPPLRRALLYSPSVRKKLNNLFQELNMDDIPEEEEENWRAFASRANTEVGISNILANSKDVSIFTKPQIQEAIVNSPSSLQEEIFYTPRETPVDMFGSLDLGTFSVNLPDLTATNEDEEDVQSVYTAVEAEFSTPMEYQEPVFTNNTNLQPLVEFGKVPKDSATYDVHNGDMTSLCSALQDIKDTSEGAIIVQALNGKKLYSETSLDNYLDDGSFNYLGDFLYGDVTLNPDPESQAIKAASNDQKVKPTSQYTDHDKHFAESLRDSSLNYLASFIRSGKTENNLQAIVNAS